MSDAVHTIEWVDENTARFRCDGDESANCHIYPDCDCEAWSDEHDREHKPVPHQDCWKLPWFENVETCDSFGGTDWPIPHRDGPIDTEWDGDGLLWTYAGKEHTA